MENDIVSFGDDEKPHLSHNMPPKNISISEDETFYHKPCLIAMDPV